MPRLYFGKAICFWSRLYFEKAICFLNKVLHFRIAFRNWGLGQLGFLVLTLRVTLELRHWSWNCGCYFYCTVTFPVVFGTAIVILKFCNRGENLPIPCLSLRCAHMLFELPYILPTSVSQLPTCVALQCRNFRVTRKVSHENLTVPNHRGQFWT